MAKEAARLTAQEAAKAETVRAACKRRGATRHWKKKVDRRC